MLVLISFIFFALSNTLTMSGELKHRELRQQIVEVKDFRSRQFKIFKDNFYLIKAAVRYFAVKNGLSFTSTKVSENFPMSVTTAGSCLSVLKDLDVLDVRTESSSPDRYMPQSVDMQRLEQIETILRENREIEEF